MELVTPGLGLIFWKTVAFAFVLIILKKYAWKPILKSISEREMEIADARQKAKQIDLELSQLEDLKARKIAEVELLCQQIVAKAKTEAQEIIDNEKLRSEEDAAIIIANAKRSVDELKNAAMQQLKSQVAALSLEMAEKLLYEELKDKENSNKLVNHLLDKAIST